MANLESSIGQDITSFAQILKQDLSTVSVVVWHSFGNKGRRLPTRVACLKLFLKWKKCKVTQALPKTQLTEKEKNLKSSENNSQGHFLLPIEKKAFTLNKWDIWIWFMRNSDIAWPVYLFFKKIIINLF